MLVDEMTFNCNLTKKHCDCVMRSIRVPGGRRLVAVDRAPISTACNQIACAKRLSTSQVDAQSAVLAAAKAAKEEAASGSEGAAEEDDELYEVSV